MSNTNRDYAIIYDIKNSSLILSRPLVFYITDKNTSNIFVRLVTKTNAGNGIDQYTDIENASSYILLMRAIKPNDEVINIKATQHEPKSIFEFDLTEDFKDIPGTYICELMISTIVNGRQELLTSDSFTYEVKRSVLSKIDQIIEHEETTVEKLLNELDATKAELDSLSNIADGSPRGVFDTLSSLQTAFPNGNSNIYITSDNGYWNYWDGSDWIAGGVYQATQIQPNSIDFDKYKDGSIIESKLNTDCRKMLNKGNYQIFGGVTKVTELDGYRYKVSISAITILTYEGKKYTFNAVDDLIVEPLQTITAKVFGMEEGIYNLTTDTQSTRDIIIFGNYYGKTTGFFEKANNYFTKDQYKKLITFPNVCFKKDSDDPNIIFDEEDKKLIINGEFLVTKSRQFSSKKSFKITPCSFDLVDYDIICTTLSDIYSDNDVTLKKVNYLDDFDYDIHVPLFYYCFGNIYSTLNVDILKNSSKILWLGDSISDLSGLPNRVAKLSKNIIYNCSIAGSVLAYQPEDEKYTKVGVRSIVEAISTNNWSTVEAGVNAIIENGGRNHTAKLNTLKNLDYSKLDKVVVFAGTNDFGGSCKMGTGDVNDKTEFWGSIKYIIETLQTKYPNITFEFITPIWRYNADNDWNLVPLQLKTYCEKIIEVANEYHQKSLNLYDTSGINKFTYKYYLVGDKLHLNDAGKELLARSITKFI